MWPLPRGFKGVWPLPSGFEGVWPLPSGFEGVWPLPSGFKVVWPLLSGFKGVWPQYWAVNTMECQLELEFIVPASLIPRLPRSGTHTVTQGSYLT